MSDKAHQHKPGPLHQTNKPFKGRKRSQAKVKTKGRIELTGSTNSRGFKKHEHREQSKDDRRNHAKQIQQRKRQELAHAKRTGSADGAPKIVALLALSAAADVEAAKQILLLGTELQGIAPTTAPITFVSKVLKQRFTVLTPARELAACMDAAKVADVVLCVMEGGEPTDALGDQIITCLIVQGLPAVCGAIMNLEKFPVKKVKEVKSMHQSILDAYFAGGPKLFPLSTSADAQLVWRHVAAARLRQIHWREKRSNVLAHAIAFDPATIDPAGGMGTLCVTGYVRGAPLSVSQIVHIAGFGDFHIESIVGPADPYALRRAVDVQMEALLQASTPETREPIVVENIVDAVDQDQTWPDEHDMGPAREFFRKKAVKKRVPAGVSDYQAAWIEEDNDDEEIVEEAAGMAGDYEMDDGSETSDATSDDMDEPPQFHDNIGEDDITADHPDANAMGDSDDDGMFDTASTAASTVAEDRQHSKDRERARIRQAAADDVMFPDEVDTPQHIPAAIRFEKYKGLRSFRSSPWDARENLPNEYTRIFQFQDFKHTRARAMQHSLHPTDGVPEGTFVTIRLLHVPVTIGTHSPNPLVVWGLLRHETKISLVHFAVQPHETDEPIKSKEPLVFQVGFRRYRAQPIYSQNNFSSDKHKYEHFLQPGRFSVASVYAPVCFPPMPVLMFKETDHGTRLVAKGSVIGVDPDRVILRKCVLSGFPYKVHKRYAVVRYMFWNADDVRWFKPIELWTKHGLRGYIREPRGEKGYMKCTFDRPIKANDSVCMSLYKRVYPKWRAQNLLLAPPTAAQAADLMPPPIQLSRKQQLQM
eukprot:TRINITY_DN5542_c0_g1_i1.p1 TRINITY_DN5542_c0_g1~~TRINITY_DN5542_c0_g1_i1.p1  ORF type:complete len:816 (-),score=150.03 TRINITY_DN5542_c0_g1_i1:83-2530(-)